MGITITLEEIITYLLEAPLFGDLDATELSNVVHIMQIQRVRPGQYLFREGQRGDAWYVMYEGQVEVTKEAGFESSVIAVLEPPQCFGEMAVLDGSMRSATCKAITDTTVFRFPRDKFTELLDDENLAAYKLVFQMARTLALRQRELTAAVVELLDQRALPAAASLGPLVTRSSVAE